jgi:hypothetical protein
MMPVHAVLLLVDVGVYHWEVSIMIVDFFMIWLNFINYMTLNKITCIMECVCYLMTILVGFTHLKRVLMEQEEWLPVFFYGLTFWIVYPYAFFASTKRLFDHWMKQNELRVYKKKGNVFKQVEEAAHQRAA